MKTICLLPVLVISLMPFSAARAENDILTFQLYQLDATIAEALYQRLVGGGEPAAAAFAKLPDLISSGKGSLEGELVIPVKAEERAEKATSKRELDLYKPRQGGKGRKAPAGLKITLDTSITSEGGTTSFLFCEHGSEEKRVVTRRSILAQANLPSGQPALVARWQENDSDLFLIGVGEGKPGSPPPPKPIKIILVDFALYPSEGAAKSQGKPEVRFVASAYSNIEWSMGSINVLLHDGPDGERPLRDLGLKMKFTPVLEDNGSIKLSITPKHTRQLDGTETSPEGEKLPKLEFREATSELILQPGVPQLIPLKLSTFANPEPIDDPWRAVITCRVL